jgi:hypothetical protein
MELYSKRKKDAENPPTAYRYDLPDGFKRQVWHIWNDSIGYLEEVPVASIIDYDRYDLRREDAILDLYSRINKYLCDEHGKTGLRGSSSCHALYLWLLEADTDTALDIIEVSFAGIQIGQKDERFTQLMGPLIKLRFPDAVAKLNRRFMENAVGYRYEQGRIIRINSEFLHTETTEPAFRLLYQQGYEGALEEFRLAHKHFRDGSEHYDDCLTNCGKALESTLKTICDRRKWAYKAGDTALKLLEVVFNKDLIPSYLQSHFSALRSTLESGVPTIRNREGGHGSGEKPNDVPEYLAAYQLHLTASAIVFLIRANEDVDKRKP